MLTRTRQQPETGQAGQTQGSLLSLTIKAYLGGIAALFVLALGAYLIIHAQEDKEIVRHAAAAETRLHHEIETLLNRYVERANLLAADPNLVDLLDNTTGRQVRQLDLAKMINADTVQLFARGEEKGMTGDYPLLSFSELDLIYEADKGREPRLEYHKLPDGNSHLDLVRPLKRSDAVVGFVLVRFDGAVFASAVKQLAVPDARLELSQVLSDGSAESFLSWGDAAVKTRGQVNSDSFAAADWRLSYWELPHGWQVLGMDWRSFYWLTFIEIVAVLALMMAVFRRLSDRAMIASANVLFDYVRDRLSGKWMGKNYAMPLDEMKPTLNNLQNLNWGAATQVGHVAAGVETAQATSAAEASELGRREFDRTYADLMYQNNDSLQVEEDEHQEALGQAGSEPAAEAAENPPVLEEVPASIFRAYDIRGVVGETLTPEIARLIGRAFGTEAWARGEQSVVVGRDGRLSSESLAEALIEGLRESGRDVIDIGRVPTPVVYFATHYLNARSAVMVTGSHNPVNHNGFKMVLQGETLAEEGIRQIYQRIRSADFAIGEGSYTQQDLIADYGACIHADTQIKRGLKVVVDCGNGVAGLLVPAQLRSLGCEVIELYCEVDGEFPNHHPDPSQPVNLQALIAAVKQHGADVGLAFDGDGDRLGVVDSRGWVIWPDRLLMLYARHILKQHPGAPVVYDVKSSRHLHRVIEQAGGQPLMWKAGHSLMKAKLKETGAVLAGELSGHIFFNDRWYGFDDGLYAAVRLLEILAQDQRPSHEVFAELPDAVSTPEILVRMEEGEHFKLMQRLSQDMDLPGAQLILIDGVRAEFKDGWGLVRASNTTPSLTLRFEAQSEEALEQIESLFKAQLKRYAPTLELTF
jgi:phosphomannomutase/phosphoglucomutase